MKHTVTGSRAERKYRSTDRQVAGRLEEKSRQTYVGKLETLQYKLTD